MLMPKRVKYRKKQRGKMKGNAQRGNSISFGTYALKAMESGWITSRQIEATRIAITRHMKREGKVWIRIFPDKPVTNKPAETLAEGSNHRKCQATDATSLYANNAARRGCGRGWEWGALAWWLIAWLPLANVPIVRRLALRIGAYCRPKFRRSSDTAGGLSAQQTRLFVACCCRLGCSNSLPDVVSFDYDDGYAIEVT